MKAVHNGAKQGGPIDPAATRIGVEKGVVRGFARRLTLVLCLCAAAGGPALAEAVKYKVEFKGAEDTDLGGRLKDASTLTGSPKDAPETLGALRRRAEADLPKLTALLRSEGFYRAEADYELDPGADPARLTFRITPGPRYTITEYTVTYADAHDGERPQTLGAAGLKPGGSPRGEDIAKLQRAFLTYLHGNGFPAARIVERRVEAAPDDDHARLALTLESGPPAVFGPLQWTGLQRTDQSYVAPFTPWKEGERFDLAKLTTFRDGLAATGLFKSVNVEPGVTDEDGVTPVQVSVAERKPRTVGVGASYSTNEGAGGHAFWEHRNLFGSAERLRTEINIAQIIQKGTITFRKPRAAERGLWFVRLEGAHEDNDAFKSVRATAGVGLERKLGPHWLFSSALEGEWSDIEDSFGVHQSTLLSLPVRAIWNTTNDPLNPIRGTKLAMTVTPHAGRFDGEVFFTTFEVRGATHIPFDKDGAYVLGLWARGGATAGPPTEEIPANHRFYSGGSGSVRGYGYQLIGPLDLDLKPVGGRSVLEGGAEFRLRFFKSFGIVTFIEAGSAFDSGLPDFEEDVLLGAGAGLRYYSPIGPLRLDFAVPLERRDGVDDSFQFYISLGQAF